MGVIVSKFRRQKRNGNGVDNPEETKEDIILHGHPFKKVSDDTMTDTELHEVISTYHSVGELWSERHHAAVGTCFRVGSRSVMTAYHVVKDLCEENSGGLLASKVFVTFDPSGNAKEKIDLRGEFIFNESYDVAILEISNTKTIPVKKLKLSTDINHLSKVYIVGYGNPNSPKKVVDPKCDVYEYNSDIVKEAVEWHKQNKTKLREFDKSGLIDRGFSGIDHESKLILSCYVSNGASGSPILSHNYPEGEVVGVLTHGYPAYYYKLPEEPKKEIDPKYLLESGIKMRYIYEWIKTDHNGRVSDLFG